MSEALSEWQLSHLGEQRRESDLGHELTRDLAQSVRVDRGGLPVRGIFALAGERHARAVRRRLREG
jgi:hypothetical protein